MCVALLTACKQPETTAELNQTEGSLKMPKALFLYDFYYGDIKKFSYIDEAGNIYVVDLS